MVEQSLIDVLSTEYNRDEQCDVDENMPFLFENSPYYNSPEEIDLLKSKEGAFSIFSLNCQSLQAKFDQLKIYLENFTMARCPFTVIALQETWLNDNHDLSFLQLEGYNFIHKPRSCSAHGGVAIYLKGNCEYKVLSITSESNIWDGLFVEVILNNSENGNSRKKVIVGNIYRPPRNTVDNYEIFCNEIEMVLSTHLNAYKEVVLTGDFNFDLLKINSSAHINNYFETMITNGYIPKIVLPTRITSTTATLIDNSYVKLSSNFSKTTAGIINYNLSDHQPHFLVLDYLYHTQEISKYVKIYTNSSQAKGSFKNEILHSCNEDKFCNELNFDPNVNYNILHDNIQKALNKHLPIKYVRYDKYKHKRNSWITQGIMRSIRFRDKLYVKLKSTPVNSSMYNTYKINLQTYNKILRQNIKLAKKSYYYDCFEKFKNDVKNTWATIKCVINKSGKKEQFPKHFLINDLPESDPEVIANKFNTYFTEIGPKLADSITPPNNKSFKDYLLTPVTSEFSFKPVSVDCVSKVIDNLKSKSSSGKDRLSNKLLKFIKEEISKPFTLIVNQILTTGIFPEKLKVAKVIPIFKKGENYIFDNYRPVSLLPSLSKVIEKIMYVQLYDYFSINKLLYESQYGFRSKHSTELAALELIDQIVSRMDKNETPINIYLDLSKAFDTLDHNILLHKLKYYGLTNISLKLLTNYLTDRQQYVEFDDVLSDFMVIQTGVPQGSILGPLLFIIYLNDIVKATRLFHPIIYADDTALSATLNSFYHENAYYVDRINEELDSINDWFLLNKLSINVNKTKAMLFHDPRKKLNEIKIMINGTEIEFVNNFNYLGIILDSNLSWKFHIKMISQKISKSICIINRLKNIVPTSVLQTLYNTLIAPHLSYGILAWGIQSKKLFKLQKRAVRIIVNAKYNAHTDPIFKQQFLLKISDLCALQELKFVFKLINNNGLPCYFLNLQLRRHSDIHSYNTRHAEQLRPLQSHHAFMKNSICFRVPVIFNSCPDPIKQKIYTHSLQGFSRYIKSYFIDSYSNECQIANCYICQQ